MTRFLSTLLVLALASLAAAKPVSAQRLEAERYVEVYAQKYGVSSHLIRSIIQQESGWNPCIVSSKGAVGLMQLMPETAKRLGVKNRCNIRENISGGVRYLAWLLRKFHGETRLAVAAFYAGENAIQKHGLRCRNHEVVIYVAQVRSIYAHTAKGGTR